MGKVRQLPVVPSRKNGSHSGIFAGKLVVLCSAGVVFVFVVSGGATVCSVLSSPLLFACCRLGWPRFAVHWFRSCWARIVTFLIDVPWHRVYGRVILPCTTLRLPPVDPRGVELRAAAAGAGCPTRGGWRISLPAPLGTCALLIVCAWPWAGGGRTARAMPLAARAT